MSKRTPPPPPRQEQLGKRLVAMTRRCEERRKELNTWELANINCRIKDIIEDVKEGEGSIYIAGEDGGTAAQRMSSMEEEELGSNDKEVDKEGDKEVDKEVNLEETSSLGSVAEEKLETGVPLHLTAAAGTAGFHIFPFIAFQSLAFARPCSTEQATIAILQVVSWA